MLLRWTLGVLTALFSSLQAASAEADPMRLDDLTPRPVLVQFEDSPGDRPDLLDGAYTTPHRAWLEPDAEGRITVRVAAEVLEESLFADNDPVPGSFSDYVWVFDRETGAVVSASFTGAFAYKIDWGFATSEVHARVSARMTTDAPGGYRDGTPILGLRLNRFCRNVESPRCKEIPPRRYDEQRGYVNAIGYLSIDSPITRFSTYSAVGEARFSEVPEDVPAVATGPAAR